MSIQIGTIFTRHGHEYEVTGFRPYTCRSGREIEIVKLVSECSVCGDRFTTTATRSSVRGSKRYNGITRTCPEHRGLGPRWGRPPKLIDAATCALADRPATFLTARQLAEATGRSANGMGAALRRAFGGRDVIKTKHGRLMRRAVPGQTSALYLLVPRGERRAATVERAAWAEWRRGVLEATAAARVAKLAATVARRQGRKPRPGMPGPRTALQAPASPRRARRRPVGRRSQSQCSVRIR